MNKTQIPTAGEWLKAGCGAIFLGFMILVFGPLFLIFVASLIF
jgi:uncharacterized membrane protein YhiD involved in acid resistance